MSENNINRPFQKLAYAQTVRNGLHVILTWLIDFSERVRHVFSLQILPWALSFATVILWAFVAAGFAKYRKLRVAIGKLHMQIIQGFFETTSYSYDARVK